VIERVTDIMGNNSLGELGELGEGLLESGGDLEDGVGGGEDLCEGREREKEGGRGEVR